MTDPAETTGQPTRRRGINRKSAILIGVLAAVLVILIVVVTIAVASGGDGPTTAAGPDSAAPAASAEDSETCDQPAGSQTPPTTAPVSSWELVGAVIAPTDPEAAGPGRVDDTGLRRCFAHDPVGALYAAVNWMGSLTDRELAEAASADDGITAPGPGLEAFRAELAASTPEDFADSGDFQIVGFRYRTYTGDDALVNIAIGVVGGGMATFPMPLHWSGEDWQLQLPLDGNLPNTSDALSSLTNYVEWSAN